MLWYVLIPDVFILNCVSFCPNAILTFDTLAPLISGYLYWGIVTIVVLYIQIVVFHIEGRHTFQEPGLGAVITKFKGNGSSGHGKHGKPEGTGWTGVGIGLIEPDELVIV